MSKSIHVWLVGIGAGIMVLAGAVLAQDEVLAPDAGVDEGVSDVSSDIRTQPKGLKDYGITGLDTPVELRSLDSWTLCS